MKNLVNGQVLQMKLFLAKRKRETIIYFPFLKYFSEDYFEATTVSSPLIKVLTLSNKI
jgi:hypothetical protein